MDYLYSFLPLSTIAFLSVVPYPSKSAEKIKILALHNTAPSLSRAGSASLRSLQWKFRLRSTEHTVHCLSLPHALRKNKTSKHAQKKAPPLGQSCRPYVTSRDSSAGASEQRGAHRAQRDPWAGAGWPRHRGLPLPTSPACPPHPGSVASVTEAAQAHAGDRGLPARSGKAPRRWPAQSQLPASSTESSSTIPRFFAFLSLIFILRGNIYGKYIALNHNGKRLQLAGNQELRR